jgi:hypothetical protein
MAQEAGGARLAVSTIAPEDLVVIEKLAHGPLYRFADWPNASVPMSAIGPLLSALAAGPLAVDTRLRTARLSARRSARVEYLRHY